MVCLTATDVVTVYIFHEPSMLSSLQESGLTGVVLKSLIVKDVSMISNQCLESKFLKLNSFAMSLPRAKQLRGSDFQFISIKIKVQLECRCKCCICICPTFTKQHW